jgi:hypothetical protein
MVIEMEEENRGKFFFPLAQCEGCMWKWNGKICPCEKALAWKKGYDEGYTHGKGYMKNMVKDL